VQCACSEDTTPTIASLDEPLSIYFLCTVQHAHSRMNGEGGETLSEFQSANDFVGMKKMGLP